MVITPLFFLITIYLIVDTYSLFESNHVTTSSIDIAKWQVKLNGDVVNGSSANFSVDNIVWEGNEYVLEGKVAPGMSGYFDVVVDPNATEVSLRYDVSFDFSNLSENQFVIDSVVEANGRKLIRTEANTYSGVILLDEIKLGATSSIRVNLSWVNDEENNDIDSELAMASNNDIDIPVVVTLWQYNNEELVEYS